MPALVKLPPSGYFRRQIFATLMDDPDGISNWSFVERDNFRWASDYPRTLATWRHLREVIVRDFKCVPDDVKSKMTGETAAKLYGLPGRRA